MTNNDLDIKEKICELYAEIQQVIDESQVAFDSAIQTRDKIKELEQLLN